MAVTLSGSTITFNDSTTQGTAFTNPAVLAAYGTVTYGAQGAMQLLFGPATYSANQTFAGSAIGLSGTWRVLQPSFFVVTHVGSYSSTNNYLTMAVRIS